MALRAMSRWILSMLCCFAAKVRVEAVVEVLMRSSTFRTSGNVFCDAGFSSGQLAGVCTLVNPGFQLGSAADIMAAARFKGFQPDGGALSTDPGVMGMVADFLLEDREQTSRMDMAKQVTGSSQVDIFLCGDSKCTTMADLIHITSGPTDFHDANTATLAMGYTRFPFSLLALPTRFLDPRMTSTITPYTSGARLDVQRVVWTMADEPQWVRPATVMSDLGTLARIMSNNANWDWSKLRLGNYLVDAGTGTSCATIISFMHPFMDEMGWNKGEDCEPTQTLIFDSYLTQAYVDLADTLLVENDPNQRNPARSTAAVLRNIKAVNARKTLTNMEARLPVGDLVLSSLYYWGVNYHCTSEYAEGPNVTDVCGLSDQYDGLVSSSYELVKAVMVGTAPVVVFNITEQNQWTPEGLADVQLDYGESGGPVGRSTAQLLLGLVGMSTLETMPWCDFTVGDDGHWYINVALPDGTTANMRDCTRTWRAFTPAWGPLALRSSVKKVLALSGMEMMDRLAVSWTNTSDSAFWKGRLAGYGTGFSANGNFLSPTAVQAAIEVTLRSASIYLRKEVLLELSQADETLTWAGALVLLSTTLVAIIATYAGRKDIERIIRKAAPQWLARSAVALTGFIAIAVPAIMFTVGEVKARANNPDGSSAEITWAYSDTAAYRIVAAVSSTFTTIYDPVAMVLVWVNLVVSLSAVFVIAVVVLRAKKIEQAAPVLARHVHAQDLPRRTGPQSISANCLVESAPPG
ncbi:hypothetical protein JKP88DRAFT_240824 [Tribonema minus]|uniref:Uncharacterized protein n=1 Tax=Tribonema minus TaxID=303371 RepID=A0A836CHJ8_9STRA|nr:hypothetical protein JKP88DRAFT_240824 [Tribonema minus]